MRRRLDLLGGVLLSLVIVVSPAMAAEFSTFPFTTNFSYNPHLDLLNTFLPSHAFTVEELQPYSDIRMDAVTYDGKTMAGVLFVTGANIIQNQFDNTTGADASGFVRKPWWVINTGRGHNTPFDNYVIEGPTSGENGATNADLVAAYGNRNLNSINYNRERGPIPSNAIFEISFPYPSDTFFIWERGMDSDIRVAAMDDVGQVIASAYILRPAKETTEPKTIQFAGYSIFTDTGFPGWFTGPGGTPQRCGSVGLRLNGATAKTLRFTVYWNNRVNDDFGPDLKVMAAPLPGPGTTVLLKEAADIIGALGEDCFKNENRQGTLINKINVATEMILQGKYRAAANKLEEDVLPKLGNCDGGKAKGTWLTCCTTSAGNAQQLVVEVIEYLGQL